ncbi:N-acetylglucosamine-1-phosphotransferase subunits alpha/beta-like, partial [Limulus polyphemus]|uniref:N-acetylglucosamine-1-phosphotransferase subunits alpha/beta-like n=1 Tax=Limulus polyphemus TaxID=6850 RepID=A0ABM1C0E9_LIMPO
YPKVLEQPGFKMAEHIFASKNFSTSDLSLGLKENMAYIQKQLDDGYLTERGYLKQKSKLIQDYMESLSHIGQPSPSLAVAKHANQTIESHGYLISDVHKSFNSEHTVIKEIYPKFKYKTKNHLGQPTVSMNKEEGRVQNGVKVPDAQMVEQHKELQENEDIKFRRLMGFEEPAIKFHQGTLPWEKLRIFDSLVKQLEVIDHLYKTSSRKSRRLLDTFADSLRHVNKLYNDFYGSETRKVPAHIAHLIDVDIMNSLQERTWSDREIRTVLTHLYNLPLEYAKIQEFEANMVNCSKHLATGYIEISTPPYERYLDSKL